MRLRLVLIVAVLSAPLMARADGPADNDPTRVRQVPRPGIEAPADDRREMEDGLAALGDAIGRLADKKDARVAALLPDVRIYLKAVRDALTYQEFFDKADIAKAKALLKEGRTRAEQLLGGSAPWTSQTGLVVR